LIQLTKIFGKTQVNSVVKL